MRIAGNLDVEVTWARMDAAARRARGEKAPSEGDPRFALPEPVMRKISAAATLLRAFAESDDDVIWTPRPVDPSRVARVEWLPTPRLESGPVPETADLWWGERTEVAARVNHRSFVHELRVAHGRALDGETIVRDLPELEARASELEAWVAKAPHSAAGRLRVRGVGPPSPQSRSAAERLLGLYGSVLLEPWLERSADHGVKGDVEESAWSYADPHRLIVDPAGRFQAIRIPGDAAASIDDALLQAASECGCTLNRQGYRGPFGVDCFETASAAARPVVRVSEVNARRTFGHVARRLAGRIEDAADRRIEWIVLRFGKGAPPPDTMPLLLPGSDDDTSAWLEVAPRHGG